MSVAAAGAAASVVLLASPASAQTNIGTMIGQASAQRQEAICQVNRQPDPRARLSIISKVNAAMRKLRTPETPAREVARLFSTRDGAKVANSTQLISQAELRTMLGPHGTPGQWKHLVVAADHLSARGVWRIVTPGLDGAPETVREIGFDFSGEWGSWKVLHAQEYPGPLFAPEPAIYCHLWQTATY